MPTIDRKLRVFLCHASQDKPIVRELYQRLLAESWIDPWLDEEKLLPGMDWNLEIEKAVEDADVVIMYLSNQSVTKEGYVQRELRFALDIALEKPEGTIFIIPLKLEDCAPPRKLRTWHYVEYFPPDKRDNSFRLIKVSMQERLKSLGLSAAPNDLKLSVTIESLSSKIISKKISDARLALQNDQLQNALDIYDVLVKQRIRLKEIINDLEDVSIVYSDSKKLWAILANAYRMDGDFNRAQEYENKIRDPHIHYVDIDKEPEVKDYPKVEPHNLDNKVEDEKQDESYEKTMAHISGVDQQSTSASLFLPSTISIETLGGISTPIFYRGDSLPAQIRNTFSTATDNQSQVEVHLVMGENKLASDNKSLGKFILDGIPPVPKGVPQIEIVLEVSQELEMNVTATDKNSGRMKNFQVVKLNTIKPPPIKDPLPPKPDPKSDNLFNSADGISDFFQTIFGIGVKQSPRSRPQGYQQELKLTLEEAYKGSIHRLQSDGKEKLVRIPAGVRTGSKVRVAGAGPNGLDLYLIISIQSHLFFTRTGSDLFMHYPVSETLAYHGGELQVPVLEKGKSIFMAIPPNTKDKQVFRFANRGFPNVKEPTNFGDLYLTVDLYDPQKMPQESKKLLDDINNHMR